MRTIAALAATIAAVAAAAVTLFRPTPGRSSAPDSSTSSSTAPTTATGWSRPSTRLVRGQRPGQPARVEPVPVLRGER